MRIAVIGGGLSGLVAAREMVVTGNTVVLLEATSAMGGQLHTRHEAGFVVEDGAEGWVSGDSVVPDICRAVGIAEQIVRQLERKSLLVSGSRLIELSPGKAAALLGIQASDQDLGGGIASLRSGMGSLAEALTKSLGGRAELRNACPVTSLEPTADGWRLLTETSYRADCDAVVLATPPQTASALLEPIDQHSSALLRSIVLHSNISVSLGFQRSEVQHPLDASGLIVKSDEVGPEGFRACAFSSSKLPNRAPDGRILVRAFFRPPALAASWEDADWIESAKRILTPILGISGNPLGSWVARWPNALPQHGSSHAQLMQSIADRLSRYQHIALTGSAYHGGGVPGAVRSGKSAAKQLLAPK
jgi:oxygen-dependent protoporphyrinogen oxidase